MPRILKWLKQTWRGPWLADLPPELAQCEDGCRVGECSQAKWSSCPNRIRRMQEEKSRLKLEEEV
jgi:hypothetical protein